MLGVVNFEFVRGSTDVNTTGIEATADTDETNQNDNEEKERSMLDEIDLKMNILQPIKSVDLADGGMEKVIGSLAGNTNLGIFQSREIQYQYNFFV